MAGAADLLSGPRGPPEVGSTLAFLCRRILRTANIATQRSDLRILQTEMVVDSCRQARLLSMHESVKGKSVLLVGRACLLPSSVGRSWSLTPGGTLTGL